MFPWLRSLLAGAARIELAPERTDYAAIFAADDRLQWAIAMMRDYRAAGATEHADQWSGYVHACSAIAFDPELSRNAKAHRILELPLPGDARRAARRNG